MGMNETCPYCAVRTIWACSGKAGALLYSALAGTWQLTFDNSECTCSPLALEAIGRMTPKGYC